MKLEKIILGLLLLVFASYFFAVFFLQGTNYVFYLKPLLIPLFVVYIILKNGFGFPKPYLFFVFLFYLGQTCMLFSDHSKTVLQVALVLYVMFYFALINLPLPLISGAQFKKIFTGVTLIVILVNAVLLFLIVYIIFKSTTDTIANCISIVNASAALALIICAVACLSISTNKKSFLYFLGAVSLISSDVFSALNVYYLQFFALNVLELILHFVGFYLIYLFIIEKNKLKEIEF